MTTPRAPRRKPVETPSLAGSELRMLDGLLPKLYPKARDGDIEAIDRVLKVLDLRLKYDRDRRVREDEED